MTDLGGWNLPFEETTVTTELVDVGRIPMAQGVTVMAAKAATPLGTFPLLVFRFDVPGAPQSRMPSICLIGDAPTLRGVARLVDQAVSAAIRKVAQP